MDPNAKVNKDACADILKNVSKNRRHYVKKQYFDKVEANKVSIKSPVSYITDAEWNKLRELWTSPRHMVGSFLYPALAIFLCVSVQFW